MINASVFLIHQYVVAHQEGHVSNVLITQTVPLKQQLNAQEATHASLVQPTVIVLIFLLRQYAIVLQEVRVFNVLTIQIVLLWH